MDIDGWISGLSAIEAVMDSETVALGASAGGRWTGAAVEVVLHRANNRCGIAVSSGAGLRQLRLRGRHTFGSGVRVLADHWERGYGDMEWRAPEAGRCMPWYFLLHDGVGTHGLGVMTNAGAFCHWEMDATEVTLGVDVRCGTAPVALGERALAAATVVFASDEGLGSAFGFAQKFCRELCPSPRLPGQPIYGGNDWYYAYGENSAVQILGDAERVASWAPAGGHRPFFVIDDGWQICRTTQGMFFDGGPWHEGNRLFPDMRGLASRMRGLGVRPGIWIRPLLTMERVPRSWYFAAQRFGKGVLESQPILDPSVPEVLGHVAADIRRLADWGYELIKHDWTTCDIMGRWGFDMLKELTGGNWAFADRSRTTVEIITGLYRTIREAAGEAMVLGCNTVGHLAAGLVEVQRTGDDTSGQEWERTRKMGVNTMAFRMPQHDAFFAADADCVGLTRKIPWHLNRQWLELVARSGTPLFVSADPAALGREQEAALREAFAIAAKPRAAGEPLDWMETLLPRRWKLDGEERTFDWNEGEAKSVR